MKSVLSILAILATAATAATVPTDGSHAAVKAAIESANPGDVITMTAGTKTWTFDLGITMPDDLTLQGAGGGTDPGTDTIIVLNAPTGGGVGNLLYLDTTNGNNPCRLQSFRIERGTATPQNGGKIINMRGTGVVVLEDVDIYNPPSSSPAVWIQDRVTGVWADSYFGVNNKTMVWFYNGAIEKDGSGNTWGDYAWLDDPGFGDGDAFYIEDCTIEAVSGRQNFPDWYAAARGVIRYNTWHSTYASSHGHGDGSGRNVGPRRIEYYNNTIYNESGSNNTSVWHRNRGGPEIFANNTVYDYTGAAHILSYYSADDDHGRQGFFPTIGRDTWTVDDSGTTDAPTGQGILVDATKSWTPGALRGKVVLVTIDSNYTKIPSEKVVIDSIDFATEEITTVSAHGWSTGETVVLDEIDNGGNITDNNGNQWQAQELERRGTPSIVNVVDADTFTIQHSEGTDIDFASMSGSPVARRIYGGAIDSVDTGADTIDFKADHDLSDDDMVFLDASSDSDVPSPLTANDGDNSWEVYFVIVTDADTIQLADSPGGSAIDLTSGITNTVYVVHVGEFTNGFHKNPYGHLKMVVEDNTATTLTASGGTINVWLNANWFIEGLSYQIITNEIAAGMPGAGKWRSVPGVGSFNGTEDTYGESNPNSPTFADFTTDFATDSNRIVVELNGEWDDVATNGNDGDGHEGFDYIGGVVRFATTGTLPAGLSVDTDYFIVEWDDGVAYEGWIEVSTTEGGAAVTLTSDGTGTHTAYLWQDPALEGVYHWGTTNPGTWDAPTSGSTGLTAISFGTDTTEDVHGFQENGSYDGSSGMGVGLLSARPASPALLNTGYYATDTEILYVWRDTDEGGFGTGDTWVEWWSEFTYPHPLRQLSGDGGGGEPDPASGVSSSTDASAATLNVGP